MLSVVLELALLWSIVPSGAFAKKEGYCIHPNENDTDVYIKKHSDKEKEKQPKDSANKGGTKVKTGVTGKGKNPNGVVIILTLLGIVVFRLKGKLNQ